MVLALPYLLQSIGNGMNVFQNRLYRGDAKVARGGELISIGIKRFTVNRRRSKYPLPEARHPGLTLVTLSSFHRNIR